MNRNALNALSVQGWLLFRLVPRLLLIVLLAGVAGIAAAQQNGTEGSKKSSSSQSGRSKKKINPTFVACRRLSICVLGQESNQTVRCRQIPQLRPR
jgi:hypothetical protein